MTSEQHWKVEALSAFSYHSVVLECIGGCSLWPLKRSWAFLAKSKPHAASVCWQAGFGLPSSCSMSAEPTVSAVGAELRLCAGKREEKKLPLFGRVVQKQVLYSYVCWVFQLVLNMCIIR